MELNGGGKKENNVEPTRRTNLIIGEASASSLRELPLSEASSMAGENMDSKSYPLRPGEPDCLKYLGSGYCRFGMNCKFNHPPSSELALERMEAVYPERTGQPECQNYLNQQQNSGNGQFVGTLHRSGTAMNPPASYSSFPVRPDEPDCPFFAKTGNCIFGLGCRFNHPIGRITPTSDCELSPLGLPLRPGELKCVYYGRFGACGYGSTCKFDHPMPAPKGVTDSLSSSSSNVPVVQQPPLESSSGPATLTESSPVASPVHLKSLPSSKPQKINSDDENVESE